MSQNKESTGGESESRKARTLLEQLPEIVRAGKRQAERIMEGLENRSRVS
jgi:hypothetical protein